MNSVQILLDRLWVTKRQDRELYFKVRSDLETVQKFARDYPGWRLLHNEHVIRLEKVPAHAEPFMGIREFTSPLDYMILCALLIFLEDREENEAFLLSELTDMIEAQFKPVQEIDWTLFANRKSLIRVMQWSEENSLLIRHEGNLNLLSGSLREEVLYENTGLSRCLAVSYPFDCSQFSSWEDYEQPDLQNTDMDRGHFRISRVYRRLLLSPAMYWQSSDDADAIYLKNQRAWVAKYLAEYTGYRLDIHRNAAFLVREEEAEAFGEQFPDTSTLSDILLLVCGVLREKELVHAEDDSTVISEAEFRRIVQLCMVRYSSAWSKEYREITEEVLTMRLIERMQEWSMAERRGSDLILRPAAFKTAGSYPEDVSCAPLGNERNETPAAVGKKERRTPRKQAG
ncbi:MAG: TIGR02678 family protein [Solobacterium sp.]|nr:TIGR02678 family protein [Solobacterium sp.]